jgi:hypothetical protein
VATSAAAKHAVLADRIVSMAFLQWIELGACVIVVLSPLSWIVESTDRTQAG